MALASAYVNHETELRADLQRCYGIDLDHAMNGGHSAEHIAALMVCLPTDSCLFTAQNKDSVWTLETILLAEIRNIFISYIYGMADKKSRGPKPKLIGPSWMTDDSRKLEARVLTVDELLTELAKPRNKKEVR